MLRIILAGLGLLTFIYFTYAHADDRRFLVMFGLCVLTFLFVLIYEIQRKRKGKTRVSDKKSKENLPPKTREVVEKIDEVDRKKRRLEREKKAAEEKKQNVEEELHHLDDVEEDLEDELEEVEKHEKAKEEKRKKEEKKAKKAAEAENGNGKEK